MVHMNGGKKNAFSRETYNQNRTAMFFIPRIIAFN